MSDEHQQRYVVVDENRDEASIWGPFETIEAAYKWEASLIQEYLDDDEVGPADWITVEVLFEVREDMLHG